MDAYCSYALKDTATYSGQTYRIVQPHTSLLGWEPPNVPALWQMTQATADTQAPTAPANLSSTAVTSTSIILAWEASTDNTGVTGYDVYQGAAWKGSVSSTTLSYTASGLSANTSYTVTVKVRDAAGNISNASNALTVITPATGGGDTQAPTAPTNLMASAKTSSAVSLSWTASSDNVGVTGHEVFQGNSVVASVTGTSFTVTGLVADTAYAFKVTAKDAAGNVSAASAVVNATTLPNITAAAVLCQSIH